MTLGFIIINLIFLLLFIFFLFQKKTIGNFIILIFLLMLTPSFIDKSIGSVELSYGNIYTQFSFLDLAVISFLLIEIYIKSFRKRQLSIFLLILILFLLYYIVYTFYLETIPLITFYYLYNYFRIWIFIMFTIFYLREINTLNISNKSLFLGKVFSFLLFLEIVGFSILMHLERFQLPYLNINVLPNTLIIVYLILILLKKSNLFYFSIFLLIIILNGSRTGLLLLVFIKFFIENKLKIKNVFYLLLIFIIVFFSNERLSELILNIDDFSKIDTIRSRVQIWFGTYDIISKNPFLGIGPGQLYVDSDWLNYLYNTFQQRKFMLSTHNEFLQQIISIGFPSAFLFFGVIIFIVVKNRLYLHFVPLFLIFMMNSNFETIRYSMIFGIYLGIVYMYKKELI